MTDFIVIGNTNAVTYKEIFPYLKDNKIWLGYHTNNVYAFETPYTNNQEDNKKVLEGMGLDPSTHILVKGIAWFTNLEHSKRREFIGLTKKYNPTDYPKYDNYDAIEVGKVTDIPKDYDGVMGVPITFLGKHNPKQFEIVGITENANYLEPLHINGCEKYDRPYLNGKRMYSRLLIRKVKELPTEEEVKNIAE